MLGSRLPQLLLAALLAVGVLISYGTSARASIEVYLDFVSGDFNARVDNALGRASTAAERTAIRAGIETNLGTMYSGYAINFDSSTPSGVYTTLNFGLTGGGLGVADHIDYRNQDLTDTARIFTGNFGFIVESGDTHAQQIAELTMALSGTAAHELGHNLGLRHYDSYSDVSFNGTNPAATSGVQNTNIMATGSTGLGETGRETLRDFSPTSKAKLEIGDGMTAGSPLAHAAIAEMAGAHSTSATAQDLDPDLDALPVSGFEKGGNVIGILTANDGADFYSFSAEAGAELWVNIVTDIARSFDSVVRLYSSDGITELAEGDDTLYDSTHIGAGTTRSYGGVMYRIAIGYTGTHYLSIAGYDSDDMGSYEMLLLLDNPSDNPVPEPGSLAIWATLAGVIGIRFRRRRS